MKDKNQPNSEVDSVEDTNVEMTEAQLFTALSEALEKDDKDTISALMQVEPTRKEDRALAENSADTDDDTSDTADDTAALAEPNNESNTPAATQAGVPAYDATIAALQQELHYVKSEAGRVKHLQKELSAIKKMIEQSTAAAAAAQKPPRESDKKIEQVEAVDPTTADTLRTIRKELEEEIAAATRPREQEVEASSNFDDEYERLLSVHPDATQIFASNYWQEFKRRLTPEQRAWAESDRAEQVVVALTEFKRWNSQAPAQQQESQTNTAVATQSQEADQSSDSIKAARSRRLAGNVTATQQPMTNRQSTNVDSGDELFKKIYNETLANMGIKT